MLRKLWWLLFSERSKYSFSKQKTNNLLNIGVCRGEIPLADFRKVILKYFVFPQREPRVPK
jgi:hypothetical protein